MMERPRMLICFAHPDDESFGLGAVISKYVERGVDVYLVCATNGDAGTVEQQYLDKYGSVTDVRLAELDCAAQKLGFAEVITFGYKDSGMMSGNDKDNPDCLWQAPQEDVTRRIVEVMRRVKPHVVITFDTFGGYGHPDHLAMHRATNAAFPLAGDASYDTGQAPYAPQKLYYSSITKGVLRLVVWWLRVRGIDPRRVGANKDVDLQAILDHTEPKHTRVDIRAYYEAWDAASSCHASQGGGGLMRLPRWLRRTVFTHQYFRRVIPEPARDIIDEDDLFAGVKLEELAVAEA